MRRGGGKPKGSSYEREVATILSEWWTQDLKTPRQDVFWRTSTSGGRATRRAKKNQKTYGSYGDIGAVDPIGAIFTDLIVIEVKRGYNKFTVADLLDRPERAKNQCFENFVEQIHESHQASGSFAWLLITRRDKREPLAFIPHHLLVALRKVGALQDNIYPFLTITCEINNIYHSIRGMLLHNFLDHVKPSHIKALSKVI